MMKRLNIHLTDSEHKRFKVACAKQGREMSDVLRELMTEFLQKSKKGKKAKH